MMDHSYMMIDFWSPWHWIVYVLFAAIVIYPIGRILARLGYSPFWSILAFVPVANLVGLWIVALGEWPRTGPNTR